jgi:hypothetical protein
MCATTGWAKTLPKEHTTTKKNMHKRNPPKGGFLSHNVELFEPQRVIGV